MHVLVTGAAGSGTSTLGQALAAELGHTFVDADQFFWLPTQPPFSKRRSSEERTALFKAALSPQGTVVAGSVMGWGAEVEGLFGLVVLLQVPVEIRIARLRQRELAR